MYGNMGNSAKARGPGESMVGGQNAGAGSMLSCSSPPDPLEQRWDYEDSASISSSGEDRQGCMWVTMTQCRNDGEAGCRGERDKGKGI